MQFHMLDLNAHFYTLKPVNGTGRKLDGVE